MIVDCAVYEQGRRREGRLDLYDAFAWSKDDETFVWIGLREPTEEEFDSVRREFQLHELAVEDAVKAHQRPKLEVYGDTLFLVLKPATYNDAEEVVEFAEILVFVGPGFIITVRHGETTELHGVREDMETRPELLKCGPSAVLHAIVDRVVDDYMEPLAGLQQDIEEVEADVFSPDRNASAERIYKLKREVLEFVRATEPLVDPLDRLAQDQYGVVNDQIQPYFRDVYDHVVRISDQLEAQRDLLTSVLTANLTQVSIQQNEDVRKISAAVAIIAVPTMIAGIYGMNFEHMPELKWELGYPLVVAVMAALCLGLYRYFKRVGWL